MAGAVISRGRLSLYPSGLGNRCWIVVSQAGLMLCLMLDLQVDAELGITSSPDLFVRLRDGEREVSRIRAGQVR